MNQLPSEFQMGAFFFLATRPVCKPHSVWRGTPPGWTSIYADGYPAALAVYPEMVGKRAFPAAGAASLLLDLAPHGGYRSGRIAAPAGGLLHHLFTLTPGRERFAFCGPDPSAYTLPGVTRHAALRCADFPRGEPRGHPADLVISILELYYTLQLSDFHYSRTRRILT